MENKRKIITVLIILSLFAGTVSAAPEPVDELHELLSNIKNYEYGQSREKLVRISEILRESSAAPHIRSDFENEFIAFLKSNASIPAKQFICEELSLFGTQKSLPVLNELFKDQQTAAMALFALERIPGERVSAQLRKNLSESGNPLKIAIINILGNRRDKKARKQILKYIDDPDPVLRSAAIKAAGKIGGKQVENKFERALKKAGTNAQFELLDAYLSVATIYGASGQKKEAVKILRSVLASGYAFQFRHAALKGLLDYSGENPEKILTGILKGDDAELQSIAIQLIHTIPAEADLGIIADAFSGFQGQQQVQILTALAGRTSAPVVRLLENALDNEDEAIRIAALSALTWSGSAESILPVAERAAAGNPAEQEEARECLYRINAPGTDQAIIAGIDSAEDQVKIELIRCASERALAEAEQAVLKQTASTKGPVRIEAVKTLNTIGRPEILPELIRHLKSVDNSREEQELVKTISAICKKIPADQGPASAVLVKLPELAQNGKQEAAFAILGTVGDPAALPVLTTGLKSKDVTTVSAAIKALSEWADDTPITDLQIIARSTQNETHHVLALRGVVRLIQTDNQNPGENRIKRLQSVMDLARTKQEKAMVLAGIATMNHSEALNFVSRYFAEPELKPEAQMAALQIAEKLGGSGVRASLPVLRNILTGTDNDHVKERAEKLLSLLEPYENFIVTWEVSGPYKMDDVYLFSYEFVPEKADGNQAKWTGMPIGLDPDNYWFIALDKLFGNDKQVAYLRNRVFSDREQDVILEIGSDDGNKVWVNGQLIHSVDVSRSCTPGDDKIPVTLKRGMNRFLLKIVNNGGGWGACAGFVTTDGSKVQGLEVEI